ncbi:MULTISPECIES: protein rhiA [Bradyrhizobium]|uniref:protein rhiA n=1 Tax=Bradyrhizobium TaxID=374 RepID=UPI00039D8C25|nr:protein rhiA [Bradyrhizobium denitrificans]MCL8485868.1 protein rhiA [Bradyrhizobium denitrificans]RTM04894.1 MAG: protein rhiA [Bradyrhizobiaceae bacterium]
MTLISYATPRDLRIQKAISRVATEVDATGTPYSLKLINNSASPWVFYVYQQLPNQQSANVFSLAWFASPYQIVPGANITFQWSIDYTFVWGQTGTIQPGVTFSAGQTIDADPASANTTTFSTSPGPNLSQAVAGQPQGSLVISDAANVPNNSFSVGIGMGSAGTFVTMAGPNLTHTFTPTPTYWIAAGTNVQVGTILDITTVTQNLQVKFPVNVYAVTCTLNSSNQWTQQ